MRQTLQGVFLPISLLAKEDPSETQPPETSLSPTSPNVRRLLLSGFLLHILLPILPVLINALDPTLYIHDEVATTKSDPESSAPSRNQSLPLPLPSSDHLARIKHMSLILSTQARVSEFFTLTEQGRVPGSTTGFGEQHEEEMDFGQRDLYNRYAIQNLLRAVSLLKGGGQQMGAHPSTSSDSHDAHYPTRAGYPMSVFGRTESWWGPSRPLSRNRGGDTSDVFDDEGSIYAPGGRFSRRPSFLSEAIEDSDTEGDRSGYPRSGTMTPGMFQDPQTRRPSEISQAAAGAR